MSEWQTAESISLPNFPKEQTKSVWMVFTCVIRTTPTDEVRSFLNSTQCAAQNVTYVQVNFRDSVQLRRGVLCQVVPGVEPGLVE